MVKCTCIYDQVFSKGLDRLASFETEDIITTSSEPAQFTESGDVTGQAIGWKLSWD